MNKSNIIAILAVIGALVVAGWVLRLTFHLMGPLLLIGIGVVVYLAVSNKRIGGPK